MSAPVQATDRAGEPQVVVLPDADAVSLAAAEQIAAILAQAVADRGRAEWATTGGSTPAGIYRHLARAPLRESVPWDRVHIWIGDERFVPRGDEWCNARIGDRDLVAAGKGTALEGVHLHAWPVDEALADGRDATWCADAYAAELRRQDIETRDGLPVLDIVLVGIGPDGHVLSVFPGSAAFDSDAWAMAIPAPTHIGPMVERITLNPGVLMVARHDFAVSHGMGKAAIIGEIFGPDWDPRRLPAQLVRRPGATWILDEAAASQLPVVPKSSGRRATPAGRVAPAGRRANASGRPAAP